MNQDELKNIFSNSTCLTPKQMKHYVCGDMTNEESHAAEVHLNSCPFCSEAIEGLFEQKEGRAAEMVTELDTNFLKNHFHLHNPQVHLNSMAPAQPVAQQVHRHRRSKSQPLWKPSSLAAALLLGFGVLWYFEFGQKMIHQKKLAQQIVAGATGNQAETEVQESTVQQVPANANQSAASQPAKEVQPPVQKVQAAISAPENPQVPQPVIVTDKAVAKQDVEKKEKQKEEAKKKDTEETVVTAYKVPLIDAYSDGKRQSSNDEEKMPSRATAAAPAVPRESRAMNVAGARVADDVYAVDGIKLKENNVSADDLFEQKKYSAAINLYRQEMNTGGRGHRQRAAVMVARCYLAMGNRAGARQVLQAIIDEGGPQKRTAKRMLNDLEGDKSE